MCKLMVAPNFLTRNHHVPKQFFATSNGMWKNTVSHAMHWCVVVAMVNHCDHDMYVQFRKGGARIIMLSSSVHYRLLY